MLAAHFCQRNSVLGEGTRRAGSLVSGCTWNVGDLIGLGHWQGDGGDATGEEDVCRCEQVGAVRMAAGGSDGRIQMVFTKSSLHVSSFIHVNFHWVVE